MTELTVASSAPISDTKKAELEKKFADKYGVFTVNYVVNDSLIGGVIVFDGEKVYNGSVKSRLEAMKKIIKGQSR